MVRWRFVCAALLAVCGAVGAGEGPTPKDSRPVEYRAGKVIARLKSRAVTESSGVACSRRNKGVFYTHNDSGDSPRLFAFDRKGKTLAVIEVRGARHRDWEDIASFTLGEKAWLMVADTGDNLRRRRLVTLYFAPEPKIDPSKENAKVWTDVATILPFLYPDGPQDCEGVCVDPAAKKIHLVSKRGRRNIYELPLPDLAQETKPAEPLRAKLIAPLTLPQTSAMDMSPDGRRAVILTYLGAYAYTRGKDEAWSKAFRHDPKRVALPLLRQAEGICYGADGRTLYVTSEGVPMPIVEVLPDDGD